MDDSKIVQLYWDRDEKAISVTADKYGSYCTKIAKNIVGNQEDAEECVNDTYLNAWNAMPPHRPSVLSTFLGKITRNIAFNRYKHNTAEKRNFGELPLVIDELADCISDNNSVEQEMDRQELVQVINDFLNTLTRQNRNIFLCRYWYVYSLREISNQFGVSENKASVSLCRTRKKLKSYLMERGYDL